MGNGNNVVTTIVVITAAVLIVYGLSLAFNPNKKGIKAANKLYKSTKGYGGARQVPAPNL
jgi:hypothetical protein